MEDIRKRRILPAAPMKDELPITQLLIDEETPLIGLRRRLSSLSVKFRPISASAASSWVALRRSKSAPAFVGEVGWWEWTWGWLLAKKPGVGRDLEMNEEETVALGRCGKRSLRHLFYKIRDKIWRRMRSPTLPTAHTFGYETLGYAQNFYGGK
ncbi:hypothetical protein HPP92_018330 [Vanilla planifolia]|uniref:Uncharacterized protein n=1 Tax=Vanilla planifolia TaxID=51239 RepID=A0A835QJS6_VANPL|nr:hypothetical protein HPP92_018330 [Vanilla planifolia]